MSPGRKSFRLPGVAGAGAEKHVRRGVKRQDSLAFPPEMRYNRFRKKGGPIHSVPVRIPEKIRMEIQKEVFLV